MKPRIVGATLTALLTAGLLAIATPAQASPQQVGTACKKAGATSQYFPVANGNDYLNLSCRKVGKGKQASLKWKKVSDGKVISSLLNVSQIWKGNSVELFIYDSQGRECFSDAAKAPGQQCAGFYLGWEANFNDSARTITYGPDGIGTTISNLQPGDQGFFQLKYQAPGDANAPIIVVKRFAFRYGD